MTGSILTKIFATLDQLSSFDEARAEGRRPFVLLDGHNTLFNLEFLEYINSTSHCWSVCIGVPYGTSLWQIGDSDHQNDQFKVRITKMKENILMTRMEKMMEIELIPYDIIPIVNYGWSGSFQNTSNNLKAILERGWNPLNQMLLLHPDLRKTMTDKDLKDELESNLFPVNRLQQDNRATLNNDLPTMRTNNNTRTHQQDNLHSSSSSSNLNMQGMTIKIYIKKLVKRQEKNWLRIKMKA
jgi:hypothetical protein